MITQLNRLWSNRYAKLFWALVLSNGLNIGLFLLRSLESQTDRYWFMLWNLFLAWLPLMFAIILVKNINSWTIHSWKTIVVALLWLGFLPNSFYMVSDLIHLHQTGEVSLLYDIVMFLMFIFNGLVAGFMSVYLIHKQLLKLLGSRLGHLVIGAVLLACSFAIYMGRSLRWNTWDILLNLDGILFDVSDRIINPGNHPEAIVTTSVFFILLGTMYFVGWTMAEALRQSSRK